MTHYDRAQNRGASTSTPLQDYGDVTPANGDSRDTTGRADGNERLTAMAGALLLALFAAECITILSLGQLLTLHFFLGTLLVGPVLLKAGSTTYRFARYYAGAPDYRRKGPPSPAMRMLGPFVIVTSLAVIGSGIMLGYAGSNDRLWLNLHRITFIAWFAATFLHVTTYLGRLPRLLSGELPGHLGTRTAHVLAGRRTRWLLLAASLLGGVLLAALTYRQAGIWLRTHHPVFS